MSTLKRQANGALRAETDNNSGGYLGTESGAPVESSAATLRFLPDWREIQQGVIKRGGKLLIDYDPRRLPLCRMNWHGAEVWQMEVYVQWHPSGQMYRESVLEEIRKGGMIVELVPKVVEAVVPTDATRVALWFRNWYQVSNFCETWDSRFGENYWYEVAAP